MANAKSRIEVLPIELFNATTAYLENADLACLALCSKDLQFKCGTTNFKSLLANPRDKAGLLSRLARELCDHYVCDECFLLHQIDKPARPIASVTKKDDPESHKADAHAEENQMVTAISRFADELDPVPSPLNWGPIGVSFAQLSKLMATYRSREEKDEVLRAFSQQVAGFDTDPSRHIPLTTLDAYVDGGDLHLSCQKWIEVPVRHLRLFHELLELSQDMYGKEKVKPSPDITNREIKILVRDLLTRWSHIELCRHAVFNTGLQSYFARPYVNRIDHEKDALPQISRSSPDEDRSWKYVCKGCDTRFLIHCEMIMGPDECRDLVGRNPLVSTYGAHVWVVTALRRIGKCYDLYDELWTRQSTLRWVNGTHAERVWGRSLTKDHNEDFKLDECTRSVVDAVTENRRPAVKQLFEQELRDRPRNGKLMSYIYG